MMNQKYKVIAKMAKPEYKMYTELLSGFPKSLIVPAAPITNRKSAVAIYIGYLLSSGT
jgi:hypothetical protein